MKVRTGHGFVTFEVSSAGCTYLSPLQAGRLRGALKDALLDLDLLGGEAASPAVPTPSPVVVPAQQRRLVVMLPRLRLTVAEISARLLPRADLPEDEGAEAPEPHPWLSPAALVPTCPSPN